MILPQYGVAVRVNRAYRHSCFVAVVKMNWPFKKPFWEQPALYGPRRNVIARTICQMRTAMGAESILLALIFVPDLTPLLRRKAWVMCWQIH
jgi:hypothetical protein